MHRKLVSSRAEAQRAIAAGLVVVGGVLEPKPATLVDAGSQVRLVEGGATFVSRGGRKLAAALEEFSIDVAGTRAIDVGASTGGFTDCLLQQGAPAVTSVDVGYGQLAWSLRTDPRVTVVERTNIRLADAPALGAPFDLVVADLSFIGLRVVADQLVALGAPDANWVLLVKPQFEAGPQAVGPGGVVKNPADRAKAVLDVATAFHDRGLGTVSCTESEVPGARGGNREYFLWLRADGGTLDPDVIAELMGAHV